jgi:hypothetical protein
VADLHPPTEGHIGEPFTGWSFTEGSETQKVSLLCDWRLLPLLKTVIHKSPLASSSLPSTPPRSTYRMEPQFFFQFPAALAQLNFWIVSMKGVEAFRVCGRRGSAVHIIGPVYYMDLPWIDTRKIDKIFGRAEALFSWKINQATKKGTLIQGIHLRQPTL